MNEQTNGGEQEHEGRAPNQLIVPDASFRSTGVAIRQVDRAMAVETAFRRPRNIKSVIQKMRAIVFYDDASARACIYALPRAKKAIVGPGVNFADALSGSYGNCRDEPDHPEVDRKNKLVRCKALFIDLESNRETWATATRRIVDSKGMLYSDDMIAVTSQACAQIARRNAILHGVPRPIWHPLYEELLMKLRGVEATFPERRDELIALFATHGVDPKRIASALHVKTRDEITLDHMVVLQGMFEMLRSGEISAEEMFDPRRMAGWTPDIDRNPLDDEEPESGAGQTAPSGEGHASPAASEPAPEPKPEAKTEAKEEPAKATKKPKPAPKPKPEPQPEPPPKAATPPPTTVEEYLTYARAWIDQAASVAEINARWKAEIPLRNSVNLTAELREPLEARKKERLQELGT
jgi:hypothetical protein